MFDIVTVPVLAVVPAPAIVPPLQALEQSCPLELAACYFEVWMLRLGVKLQTCNAPARWRAKDRGKW